MSEVVFIHGVGETPGPAPIIAKTLWISALAAPYPSAHEHWLRDNSEYVSYQDWSWYPDQGEDDRRSHRTWETMRNALSDVFEEARAAIDSIEPERLQDLSLVVSRWSESERVLAASNQIADQMSGFNMWQVPAFLENLGGSRTQIINRVAAAVTDRTRVIVAHSLGSVVAFEALHALDLSVEALITLGSPLGVPGYVYDRLQGPAEVPACLTSWTNINHPSEPVAAVNELGPHFAPNHHGCMVQDLEIPTDSSTPWHAIDAYLHRDEVRRVIWTAIAPPLPPETTH